MTNLFILVILLITISIIRFNYLTRKEKEEEEKRKQERIRILQEYEKKKREREKREREKREREKEHRRELELQKELRKQKQFVQHHQERKSNWILFQQLIKENGITKLYHFTDISNLSSIKKHGGLYSWMYCENHNIPIPSPGGDTLSRNLDTRYDLQNYVRLSFTKNHPMMYVAKNQGRLNTPVILEINPEVIYWKGTKYSNMNATRTEHSEGENIEDFKKIRFDIVKQNTHFNISDELKKFYQAEIMVKEHIPLSFITNLDKVGGVMEEFLSEYFPRL